MASKGGDGGAPAWDRVILILLLGTSGSGVLIGGAGNSRVAEQLDRLGKAVENATHELVEQRRAHEEFKTVTDRRMSELEGQVQLLVGRMQQIETTRGAGKRQ